MKEITVAVFYNPKTKETKKYVSGDFSHIVPTGFVFVAYESMKVSDALHAWLYEEVKK